MTHPAVSTAVIWALPDLAHESALVAAAPAAGLRLMRRCVDAADLLAHASIDAMTVIVVSDGVPRLDSDIMRRLTTGRRQVVGVTRTASGARRLLAWGATAVVDIADTDPGTSVARIARACQDATIAKQSAVPVADTTTVDPLPTEAAPAIPSAKPDRPARSSVRQRLRLPAALSARLRATGNDARTRESGSMHAVIAVWAAPGSPGCTTTAIGMADELARRGRRVLLVDADVHSPSVALVLGITEETSGLLLATRQAEHGLLTSRILVSSAREYRDGLVVLTGLPHSDRRGELRANALEAIWSHAREAFDVTIIDIGGVELSERERSLLSEDYADTPAQSVLAAADAVVIVTRGDALGLSRLAQARLPRSAGIIAVVDPPRRASKDALDVVANLRQPALRIDWDDAWADALRDGATLAETRPRARARRAYHRVADTALAIAARADVTRTDT